MGGKQNIRTIPIVREFLLSPDVLERFEQIQEHNGLPVERAIEYLTLTRAVLDGVIALDHMPALIAEAFGVDEARATKIACDVAGARLLPLEDYFPGTEKQIAAWGGNVADYPATRIGKEKVTVDHFAGRMTEELSLTLQPNHIRRLGFLVQSYYAGEKTKDATLTFFARPVTIGGLGLTPEVAASVMAYAEEQKERIDLVDDPQLETFPEEPETDLDAEIEAEFGGEDADIQEIGGGRIPRQNEPIVMLPEVAPSHEVATTTPIAAKPPVSSAPDPEIAAEQKKLAKQGMADTAVDDRLKQAVAAAVNAAAPILQKLRIAKKAFADVAALAIRGVRDPYQTRSLLERDYGATGEDVIALLEAIMEGERVWNVREERGKKKEESVHGAAKEREVLDKRFAAVVQKLPVQSVEPVMPSARVSAARTKEEEIAQQAAKIDPAKLDAAAEASRPQPAKAMLTVGSVPPSKPGEQKIVADVQYRPRLAGPVEELGTMAPADFRRLSSNPAEAVQKIEDLLASLESTSYDDRIRGVQAWRKSPVNALYVAMANEALQGGVSLTEIASRRRNQGEESLSPAEIKAIGGLNAKIRF